MGRRNPSPGTIIELIIPFVYLDPFLALLFSCFPLVLNSDRSFTLSFMVASIFHSPSLPYYFSEFAYF